MKKNCFPPYFFLPKHLTCAIIFQSIKYVPNSIVHKEQESNAFNAHRESGRVEAGRRKLREVHLGVSWLNMNSFLQVGWAFAALRHKRTK